MTAVAYPGRDPFWQAILELGHQEKNPDILSALFQRSFDSLVLAHTDSYVYLLVSDSFCDLIGYERHEVIGKTATDLNLVVDPAVRDLARRQARAGVGGIYFVPLRHRDGSLIPVEYTQTVLGEHNLTLSIIRRVG